MDGRTTDETWHLYFPDAKFSQKDKISIINDICKNPDDGYLFSKEINNFLDSDFSNQCGFAVSFFISSDAQKITESYEVTQLKDNQAVFFLETNEDTLSEKLLFAKMADNLKPNFLDKEGKMKTDLFDNEFLLFLWKNVGFEKNIIVEFLEKGNLQSATLNKSFLTRKQNKVIEQPHRLGLNYPSMNIYELTRQTQRNSDELKYRTKILQIEIIKAPKNFSEKLEFKIKTDLPNSEKVSFSIMDSDNLWDNKPAREDTLLENNNFLQLGSAKYITTFQK